MKRDTVLPFLAGVAVATAFLVGLGATRTGSGNDIQKIMLVDGQGRPIVGQGRYLPIGTANGGSIEIRSAPFGLQVQGLK